MLRVFLLVVLVLGWGLCRFLGRFLLLFSRYFVVEEVFISWMMSFIRFCWFCFAFSRVSGMLCGMLCFSFYCFSALLFKSVKLIFFL